MGHLGVCTLRCGLKNGLPQHPSLSSSQCTPNAQGKVGPQGESLDVYTNFKHYGTQSKLAGLLRSDMHKHPFREGLEEVRAGRLQCSQVVCGAACSHSAWCQARTLSPM